MSVRGSVSSRIGIVLVTLAMGGAGCAQKAVARSFADIGGQLKRGNTVYITDTAGRQIKGRITATSASSITLGIGSTQRDFSEADLRAIDRYGDSILNGTLIGLGFGAAAALMADVRTQACRQPGVLCPESNVGDRVGVVAMFTGIGAGIDALIRGRRPVFRAPARTGIATVMLTPVLGRDRKALIVSVGF